MTMIHVLQHIREVTGAVNNNALAASCGLNPSIISKLFNGGNKNVSINTLHRISFTSGIDLQVLVAKWCEGQPAPSIPRTVAQVSENPRPSPLSWGERNYGR